jgi:hypothetical protein
MSNSMSPAHSEDHHKPDLINLNVCAQKRHAKWQAPPKRNVFPFET